MVRNPDPLCSLYKMPLSMILGITQAAVIIFVRKGNSPLVEIAMIIQSKRIQWIILVLVVNSNLQWQFHCKNCTKIWSKISKGLKIIHNQRHNNLHKKINQVVEGIAVGTMLSIISLWTLDLMTIKAITVSEFILICSKIH